MFLSRETRYKKLKSILPLLPVLHRALTQGAKLRRCCKSTVSPKTPFVFDGVWKHLQNLPIENLILRESSDTNQYLISNQKSFLLIKHGNHASKV